MWFFPQSLSPLDSIVYSLTQGKMFPPGTKWHTFESKDSSLKVFPFYIVVVKVALKKFVPAANTKIRAFALDSAGKRDKGFVIVCVTLTHTKCRGASAATSSRKYEPIAPDKTCTSEGRAARGSKGRHHLRYMTKKKKHDSLAWEKQCRNTAAESSSVSIIVACSVLLPGFGSSFRVINDPGQTGADGG